MFKKKVPKPSRPDGAAPGKTGGDGAPPGPPGGIPPHLRPQEAKKGAPPPGAPPPNAIKPGQKKAKPPVDRTSHLEIDSTTKKAKAEAKCGRGGRRGEECGRSWFGGKKDKEAGRRRACRSARRAAPRSKDRRASPFLCLLLRGGGEGGLPRRREGARADPVHRRHRRRLYSAPKKAGQAKKFKLEKPAPAHRGASVPPSVQEQLVRAEPPLTGPSSGRRLHRPPPGAPPGKAAPV